MNNNNQNNHSAPLLAPPASSVPVPAPPTVPAPPSLKKYNFASRNAECGAKNYILIHTPVKRKYYLKIKINLVFICGQIILIIKDISALQRI